MSKRYPAKIIARAKWCIVDQQMTAQKAKKELESFFPDEKIPVWQTIDNWAKEETNTGKTWYELADEQVERIYEGISDDKIEQKFRQRIWQLLNDEQFDSSNADGISKLLNKYQSITDPSRRIEVIYVFLKELVQFCQEYHPTIVNKAFLRAVKEYKNYKRQQLSS